jgi:hypothetical protein
MNEFVRPTGQSRARPMIWLLLAAAAAGFVVANVHLVYVAITSQPACVTHLKHGEGDTARGLFSAAQSSCSAPAGADHS